MAAVHSAVIVRTLTAFGLHIKSYTIFREEKGFGARFEEISGWGKEGRWTWWWTTLIRSTSPEGRHSDWLYELVIHNSPPIRLQESVAMR
jgi:hypothetical protein